MAAPVAPQGASFEADEERVVLESTALERTAARIRHLDLPVDTHVIVDAQPAHVIVDFASRHRVDLIAMTTHGRGALKRLVVGSVSDAVLRAAPTHVLLYRPEHPAPAERERVTSEDG